METNPTYKFDTGIYEPKIHVLTHREEHEIQRDLLYELRYKMKEQLHKIICEENLLKKLQKRIKEKKYSPTDILRYQEDVSELIKHVRSDPKLFDGLIKNEIDERVKVEETTQQTGSNIVMEVGDGDVVVTGVKKRGRGRPRSTNVTKKRGRKKKKNTRKKKRNTTGKKRKRGAKTGRRGRRKKKGTNTQDDEEYLPQKRKKRRRRRITRSQNVNLETTVLPPLLNIPPPPIITQVVTIPSNLSHSVGHNVLPIPPHVPPQMIQNRTFQIQEEIIRNSTNITTTSGISHNLLIDDEDPSIIEMREILSRENPGNINN